jgi:hypothetical protein
MARTVVLVLLLAACSGPSEPPPAIGNTGAPPPVAPGPSTVSGVISSETGEPLVGATIVLTGEMLVREQITLTNENGQYSLVSIPAGTYELHVFYADVRYLRRFDVSGPTTLNQAMRVGAGGSGGPGSGRILVCSGDSAASCK